MLIGYTRVPNIITEAVAVSLLGFFAGPFFATVHIHCAFCIQHPANHDTQGISVGSKMFPPEIVSSAIGKHEATQNNPLRVLTSPAFVFVLGQIGGSIFPAITGVIAAQVGVKVLQPILVGLLGATAISWLLLPKPIELHRD
jgi:hypothetical protein